MQPVLRVSSEAAERKAKSGKQSPYYRELILTQNCEIFPPCKPWKAVGDASEVPIGAGKGARPSWCPQNA
jgi:hypothetical protein